MPAVDIEKLVHPGEVLAGKYRIERVLGQGGMGIVVAAHHIQLDERVAIKFLLPDAVNRADLVARFEREARAAVKIKSEHVARVIDVGVLESGSPYMVMEYLEGVDLAQRLEKTGRISVEETADFVLQACEAIVEAHALGIIHRDLKPANLFCIRGSDGLQSIKVLDFGISKSGTLSGSSAGMTQTQSMLGSPFYMSPEQMQSAKNVDMRTDIWALGVILYQCVTGIVPFEAETLPELVLKIVTQPLPPLKTVRPDIPTAFDQLVLRCLDKDRDRRFQHIGELANALVGFAPDRGRAAADRIMRVVMTSGIGARAVPQSSPHLPVSVPNPAGTQQMAPVPASVPQPAPQSYRMQPPPSSTGPQPWQTTPIGPPPGTLPPGQRPSGRPGVPGQPQFANTNGSFGNTNRPEAARKNALIFGLVGGALVAVLGVALFLGKSYADRRHAAGAPSASASVSVPVPLTASAPPPVPSASVAEQEAEVVADAGMAVAAAVDDAGAPKPVVVAPPTSTPTSAALPTSRLLPPGPAPKAGCNPPYFIDAKGNHVFKKECL